MTDDTARDEFPELATNEDWRVAMAVARKERKISQDALAEQAVAMAPDILKGSQGVISRLESGEIQSSRLVVPICRILDIPLPSHYVSDVEREWAELGRRLRERSSQQEANVKQLIRSIVDETDPHD